MNFKVDAKAENNNIPKERLHEAKKYTNQGESDKFDSNDLYFSNQTDIPHYKTLLVPCNATICSLEIPHFHCNLCNEESFTTHYQLKRHANQTHFNQKHYVAYKSFICFPCKKRSHTATSSARKINHYHCPFCSITVKQKSNFLSHIAKHDYKKENIISKEGETPAELFFTDKDINEEKCSLNLNSLQTTKKNATFKIGEKVNCDHCGIELRKDNLRRYIKTKHQKEEPSCECVDIENAVFMVPKNNKHQGYPLHMQKKYIYTQWHGPLSLL